MAKPKAADTRTETAKLTKRKVDATHPDPDERGDVFVWDEDLAGFGLRVKPSGHKSFLIQYRNAHHASRRLTLGAYGVLTVEKARKRAKAKLGDVAEGRDPIAEDAARVTAEAKAAEADRKTVSWVLDEFMARYVRANKLRSADEIERVFDRYVRPRIGTSSIYGLRRSQIVKMLDEIADDHGPVMADRTLAHVRKAFTWQAARDDEFNSPIVRGMARTKPKDRARKRTLTPEELRDVWNALDTMTGPYPPLVRLLALTALRREDVGGLRRRELEREDLWTIPAERFKGGQIDHAVPLTKAARAIVDAQPDRLTSRDKPDRQADHVFSRSGRKPFAGWSKSKAELDRKIAELRKKDGREPMAPWVLHDLRRTARSLMSQAGVAPDVAERVLGHVMPGVRGVYDRYAYLPEKRAALERLAKMVDAIINPPKVDHVIRLRTRSAS